MSVDPNSALEFTRRPLLLSIGSDVLAEPFAYDRPNRTIKSGLYGQDNRIIDLSRRVCGVGGDRVVDGSPEVVRPEPPEEVVEDRAIYLGNLMGHYGHFITESVSTLWAMEHFPGRKAFFHPFIFGSAVHPWMTPFFEAFGLVPSDVGVIRRRTLFRDLVIPERALKLNAAVHPAYGGVGRRVVRNLGLNADEPSADQRVFLSRSRLEANPRQVLNEDEVEDLFGQAGFRIVHPQELEVRDQIALYASTRVIAGFAGSALHNCIFLKEGGVVVEIGDQRSPRWPMLTQTLCAMGADRALRHIPFVGAPEQPGAFDLDHVRRALTAILDGST